MHKSPHSPPTPHSPPMYSDDIGNMITYSSPVFVCLSECLSADDSFVHTSLSRHIRRSLDDKCVY